MKEKDSWLAKKNVYLFLPLFFFWLILSPKITVESIAVGAVVCLMVVMYSKEIAFSEKEMPLYYLKKLMTFLRFILTLIVEIVKANIDVALIVLNPSLPISPCFVKVPMMLKNDVAKVIYGNAVTLTPGTLTVDVEEDGFVIHALTKEAAEGMTDSILEHYCCLLDDKTTG
ncbi:multisubunit sodium/proton antiporter, MrpE subunit [Clostridium aceticum]|uniref:Multisubunit sodium/proton antiporter, MrpE subunit n=1 Tax=Clostridium aceticum TaxID=84022 RepID=A0A0G3WEH0_9CLOT|nr:Na+/H+ antiporter subunit E [Clostridium aceticum]AKL96778.1 multisubunit sodium/proton antiporter, MrpE subunit [Clostridium aceticum]